MTTAHRPTFHAAVGGKEQGGGRYVSGVTRTHVHDLASQMNLKRRAFGQGSEAELGGKDLRAALEAREAEHLQAIGKAVSARATPRALPPPPLPPPMDEDDDDDDGGALLIDPEDADDKFATKPLSSSVGDSSGHAPAVADGDSDEEDDDDDDDEEELMRELERIKKERAQEAMRKEREAKEDAAAEHDSAVVQGNPLLDPTRAGGSTFTVKRRWDDDVVFKNQSREPKKEGRRFINDTVRNDFHRRFLNKYVK
eukprot:CAMPEP_0115849130 /NCGR_PEP_ID=MMETSP0287-20121206/11290_1 /TAXON_ID=412157 /ORGANISM="Chrysochromulina rotalis, Strain UIO044" /LENGTH=253 /DNA_ID=CAMNT_0003303087 /DNA_START=117 /DNA_END=878 /DNA_ORIENTATION=+